MVHMLIIFLCNKQYCVGGHSGHACSEERSTLLRRRAGCTRGKRNAYTCVQRHTRRRSGRLHRQTYESRCCCTTSFYATCKCCSSKPPMLLSAQGNKRMGYTPVRHKDDMLSRQAAHVRVQRPVALVGVAHKLVGFGEASPKTCSPCNQMANMA